MDLKQLARSDSLRRHAALVAAGLRVRAGALEPTGHLSFRRGVRRDGTSLARNDSRVWRSRFVRPFQMALYFRAGFSGGRLHDLFLVGPERDYSGRFLLGRLARHDADLRLLPDLRCKNGLVRRAHSTARFRNVRNLVRDRGHSVVAAHDRHA